MPRLSIIIPCLSGPSEFDGTLVSVLQNRPRDCEVLVAHAEPYDDPYNLAGEVRFLPVGGEPSLVQTFNAALQEARGDVVHVVGCGVEVEEHWTEPALAHFVDPDVAAVSPLLVCRDDRKRVAAAGVAYRTAGSRKLAAAGTKLPNPRLARTPIAGPTLRAGFYRREVLSALGGLDEHIADEHADLDLALTLARLEQRIIFEPASRLSESLEPKQQHRSGAVVRGRSAERLFWRNAAQQGWALSLLLHPWAIAGGFAGEAPQINSLLHLIGRAAAVLECGAVRAYQKKIATAAEQLSSAAQPSGAVVSLTVARAKAAHAAQEQRTPRRKAA